MNRIRALVAGLSLLLVLSGCSEETKVVNAVGSYAPVIYGVSIDREPAVRGQDNELTLVVTNVNGVALTYHWKADAGVLVDSTAQTVTWTAPDTIGTYSIYASIEGTDVNGVYFWREKTFPIYVDNEFTRWTSGEAIKQDVAPQLAQAVGPGKPLVYAEIENPSTGQSRVLALDAPMGAPVELTGAFFAATGPTISADGNWVAFSGKTLSTKPGNSIYTIPATGSGPDTTTALPVALYHKDTNPATILANPRFARTGTMLAYNSDSTSSPYPSLYLRDGINLNVGPSRLAFDFFQAYWMPAWGPADTILCQVIQNFGQSSANQLGIYKVSAIPTIPPPPSFLPQPGRQWQDTDGTDCDWSPDGQYVVYALKNTTATTQDRDIWINRYGATSEATAVRVTSGPADDAHPRFSHDGSTIYFLSNRADRYGLNGIFGTERRGYNIWSVKAYDLPQ
jgi:hypothetical protein